MYRADFTMLIGYGAVFGVLAPEPFGVIFDRFFPLLFRCKELKAATLCLVVSKKSGL
jgi:hypothetical protein